MSLLFVSYKNNKPKYYFQYAQEENGAGSDSDDDSDVPDELKQDYVDEMTGENTPPKPRYEFPSCDVDVNFLLHLFSPVQWDYFYK